jgi:flagellar hook-associated protein 2
MAIKITGMYSGLDTESIISELASAQSYKKNKLVKAQTKLSWKQDAWKALNTKIYNFYSKTLSDLRFEYSFIKKSTKVSNSNAISIVSGENAANGVNTVKVNKLAKTAYLTGADLTTEDGVMFTSQATLKQLGFNGEGSFDISGSGVSVKIDVNEDMTLDDVVNKFKEVGLNASFDQDNQRFFISSAKSGAFNNFTLTANDSNGMDALAKLGLLSSIDTNSEEYKGYKTWADYATDTAAYQKVLDAEVAKRAAAYKAANDQLAADNEQIRKNNITNQENLAKLAGYDPNETRNDLKKSLYGSEDYKQDAEGNRIPKVDADGNQIKDDDGNIIYETEITYESGSIGGELKDAKDKLESLQKTLEDYKKDGSTATEEQIEAVEQQIANATTDVEAKQKAFDEAETRYAFLDGIETNKQMIADNEATIGKNEEYFNADGTGTQKLADDVKAEFDQKVANAQKVVNGDYNDLAKATKVDGCDAEIIMNGAKFTSMSNTFTINGLTFSTLEETDKDVTLTTTEDTDGIYNMIKNFFSEYNKLINEMDSLYNADAAKGYDPLLSEEKKELSDSEVEEWEKKIKDSLLRKDSTLGTVSGAMKTILMQGVEVNGRQMYLSDFGINTLSYFTAPENERNAYHIDGDADDSSTAKETDVLKAMISSDPDTVTAFFTGLSKKLYESLTDKMSATTLSSALTVYNDKQMKTDYDSYTEKISKQEDKLNDLIDKWYKKFSEMETALSKLQSKNSAVSSMFGG